MESEIKRLAEKNVECERQIIEHKRTDLSKMAETKKRSEELTHLQCRYDTLQEEYRQYKVCRLCNGKKFIRLNGRNSSLFLRRIR